MATIEEKFKQMGNSIINLVGTRASRNIDNLSTVGRANIESIANTEVENAVSDLKDRIDELISDDDSSMGTDTKDIYYRNIGEIVASNLPLTDAGLHLLDGSLLQGEGIYKEFVEYVAKLYAENSSANYFTTESEWQNSIITYGVCGKFVYDSENNTVRLPKVTGIIEGTVDPSALGDLVEAGLPNIEGNLSNGYGVLGADKEPYDGAFTRANGTVTVQSGASVGCTGLNFDAIKSSSIYGNSSTVQPQAIKVLYYIAVATTTKTDIEIDIDNIAIDLNGKCDVDGTNATFSHVTESYVNGTSWYRVYSDGWCEQGGVITLAGSNYTVNLLKEFKDAGYTVVTNPNSNTSNWPISYVYTKQVKSLTIDGTGNYTKSERTITVSWLACGYLAEGEY